MKFIQAKKFINKKLGLLFLFVIIGVLVLGIIGFVILASYGGNNCDGFQDKTCDCFCCHLFGSRGYESCSELGLYLGALMGVLSGLISYRIYSRKILKS